MTAEAWLMMQSLREPERVYEAVLYLRRRGMTVRRAKGDMHRTPLGTTNNAGIITLAQRFGMAA